MFVAYYYMTDSVNVKSIKHNLKIAHRHRVCNCLLKSKVHPRPGHEGAWVEVGVGCRGIALLFLVTSALEGGGWSTPRPGRFTPGKVTRYPLYRRLVTLQGRFAWVRKISLLPGFDPRTLQFVAIYYTN
jgi:hypothetical protein